MTDKTIESELWQIIIEETAEMPRDGFDLVDHAKRFVETLFTDMEPEEDILPFMVCRSTDGRIEIMFIDLKDDPKVKDELATVMTAQLLRNRATEAVFGTCAWMVSAATEEEIDKLPASKHPERVEIVNLSYSKVGASAMHHAQVVRSDGPPKLGEWKEPLVTEGQFGGRFGEAIGAGIELSRALPDEMYAMQKEIYKGDEKDELAAFVRIVTRIKEAARERWEADQRNEGQRDFEGPS